MAFGDEFISSFNPSGGFQNLSVDYAPEIGIGSSYDTGFDFSNPSYSQSYSALPDYSNFYGNVQRGAETYMDAPSYNTSVGTAFNGSFTPPSQGYQMPSDVSLPMGDGSGGSQSGIFGNMTGSDWAKAITGGLGVLGNTYSSMQTNKMNKKALKQNAKVQKYQNAVMDRANHTAEVNAKLNNSYDTTTPGSVKYNALTADQAAHYGETGAPHQQYEYTPGVTTRNYLANGGFAHGGQADTISAMLSEGEFVIPADVVSILGDGNTRAGGSALQQMMEQIRSGAGRTNTKTIPAKAKPAATYLKGRK